MTLTLLTLMSSLTLAADLPSTQPVTFHPRGDESIALEGRLRLPVGEGPFAATVICHPDPRYGGSMDVPVVRALESALVGAGYATLLSNLRGVGESSGKFDGGKGEVSDCLGALDFLRSQPRVDPKRTCLVGYSFGSWVGLQACVADAAPPFPPPPAQPHSEGEGGQAAERSSDAGVKAPLAVPACVCLAFPVPADEDLTGHPYFRDISFPTLFLTGDQDEISCLATIRALVQMHSQGERCTIRPIPCAGHFFGEPEQMATACEAIIAFLSRHCPPVSVEVAP